MNADPRGSEDSHVVILALTLSMLGVVLCLVSVTAVLLYMVKRLHGLVALLRADNSETCTGLLKEAKPPPSPKKQKSRRTRAPADTSCGISEVDEESDHRL